MSFDLITGCLLLFLIFLVLWLLTRRPRGLPPGPPLLPVLGNLLSMDTDPRVTFNKLRKKYGDIFSVYMLHQPIIVLNGYSVLRDALVKNGDVFSDRPHSFVTDVITNERGIVGTSGTTWKEQRKFALSTLRDLGMGKSVIEDRIKEELVEFLKALEDENGQPFDCTTIFQNAVSNVICSTVFGKRFDYSDPLFRRFLSKIQENFTLFGASSILNIIPGLRHLPGDLFKVKLMLRNVLTIHNELIKPNIEQHMKQDEFEASDDFITAYIKEMKHRQQQGSDTTMDSENLQQIIADLFVGGTETTSTILRWTLVYFLNNPDVQEKCFQEIKENIGLNRPPSMKDKTSLPYLEATIMEVLRRTAIFPTSLPHAVSQDIQFHGYTFPKGVTVIPMLDSVLQDPTVWGDPENFRPERFLDNTGNLQKKMEEFIPFSFGRRVCLGESLARMELLLFLASMIQRFKFITADGVKPSLIEVMGFTISPKPFKVRAVLRD